MTASPSQPLPLDPVSLCPAQAGQLAERCRVPAPSDRFGSPIPLLHVRLRVGATMAAGAVSVTEIQPRNIS